MTEAQAQTTTLSSARERLDTVGAPALSDADLFTILLAPYAGSRRSLKAVQQLTAVPLQEIARASLDELVRCEGIGDAGASALLAAFELGHRVAAPPPKRGEYLLSPQRVFDLMRRLAQADHEEFHVVLMDARGRLMRTVRVATGSLVQVVVPPAEAFREAIRSAAHGVIFVHCHPSGDPSPSQDDRDLTTRLREASRLLGIVARDHVIVSTNGYYSFVEAGYWHS